MTEETVVVVAEKVPNKIEKIIHKVKDFFNENKAKFESRRQASKYLMGMGKVYKNEHEIPLENKKRGGEEIPKTPKSSKKKVRKLGK